MNITHLFLSILKPSLYGTSCPEIPSMDSEQWNTLYDLSQKQLTAPLIFQQIFSAKAFQSAPLELQKAWKSNTLALVGNQARKSILFLMLYEKMQASGLHPLVVKGIVCRELYPQPDLRISSDEDLYLPRDEFPIMDQLLMKEGFFREELENGKEYQEVGYHNRSNGLYLEIHMDLFAKESGAYGHFNQLFTDAFQHSKVVNIQGTEVHTLSPEQHFLYLICHSLKHFLHSGFGIRQLCDILLFGKKYHSDIHWNHLKRILKKYHMYAFTMNLLDIGVQYLGFSWKDLGLSKPSDVILDSLPLLDDMMDGGIFGKNDEGRIHSANITLNAASRKSSNIVSGIWASLFPGKDYIQQHYGYAKKYPVLLPIAYLHRIKDYLIQTIHIRKNGTSNSTKVGMNRVKLLKKYKIVEK